MKKLIFSITLSLAAHLFLGLGLSSMLIIKPKKPKLANIIAINLSKFKPQVANIVGAKSLKKTKILKKSKQKPKKSPNIIDSPKLEQELDPADKTRDDERLIASLPQVDSCFRAKPILLKQSFKQVPYPERARLFGIEGRVKMLLHISPEGRVVKANIISGPGFGLRKAALQVAQILAFLPATNSDGLAINSQIEHEVIFNLIDLSMKNI